MARWWAGVNGFSDTSRARWGWVALRVVVLCCLQLGWPRPMGAQSIPPGPAGGGVVVLEISGSAERLGVGAANWAEVRPGQRLEQGERFRTRRNSRATLRLSDLSQVRVGELSELQVRSGPESKDSAVYKLWKGVIYFFHRDKPGRFRLETPIASAAVRGTEFMLRVDETERTVLVLIDGEVDLASDDGQVKVRSGEMAVVERGVAPRSTAVIWAERADSVQWALYYPAVLFLPELGLGIQEEQALEATLTAYRAGDILEALERYPADRQPGSDAERIYHAALLLAVGQVERAGAILDAIPLEPAAAADRAAQGVGPGAVATVVAPGELAGALKRLVAMVKGGDPEPLPVLTSATGALVESYVRQARSRLPAARAAARVAVERAVAAGQEFSFARARLAELEFGFGKIRQSMAEVEKALGSAPRNAQAIALKGFLLGARNQSRAAIEWFDRAIGIDGGLGNAWLGRGLSRIRLGETREGVMDLQTAAVLEPLRSVLRSYLGKGYAANGRWPEAARELDLARGLDPEDPTPWLYSALLKHEQRRVNAAVTDLERSVELNDRRGIYRSRFLLDEDRAVRSASLATLYQDSGMPEVGLREAVRAASDDYANYSAHLFVSQSFNALRDPTRYNLRHEAVWFNELLLANLLSPVGGTLLSQNVSLQEYSRFFDSRHVGLSSSTEYRGDGQYVQTASQYGVLGSTAWSLDLDYQHNNGVRRNNDLDRTEWYSTLKQQLGAQDSLLLLTKFQDYHAGDNFQYSSPASPRPHFRYDEDQSPILAAGYHREWAPGVHTLFLGGRLENDQRFTDQGETQYFIYINPPHPVISRFNSFQPFNIDLSHRTRVEIYTAEFQQILENEWATLLFGGRYQNGPFHTQSRMMNPSVLLIEFQDPAAELDTVEDFERISSYAYQTVKLPTRLRVTAGVTYDRMEYPVNFRAPPVRRGSEMREVVTPKVALVWDLLPQLTVRATHGRSLGGVTLDESYRLEPTQLAGFSHAYRTLIPESLVGSVSAPVHEVSGAALDLKLSTHTYLGVQAELLRSEVHHDLGLFYYYLNRIQPKRMVPANVRNHLEYEERDVTVTLHQLLSQEWSFGAQYAYTRSDFESTFPRTDLIFGTLDSTNRAELHHGSLSVLYNHPSGLFAQVESHWYLQHNLEPTRRLTDDAFHQINLFAGYRFPRLHGDLTLGLLNVGGEDYNLNPVTPHPEFPREQTLYARLRLRF